MLESLAGKYTTAESADTAYGESVLVENATGKGRFVIACEHASNFIPSRFGDLGLDRTELRRHIAWDPGALGVARALGRELDAPVVSSRVSRLVIDCNRDPSVFDAIPARSEDTVIPGNADVSGEERRRRVVEIYEPFHAALGDMIAGRKARGSVSVIGVHSFTPLYHGVERPWHVGILYDRDESLSAGLLQALRADGSYSVGANQPYSPRDRVYHTLDRHGQSQGLPSVMVEIRNDLLQTVAQEEMWGMKLASILRRLTI